MTCDISRISRCIISGAFGDAFGGPYENRPGPIELQENASLVLSDDTQLTLATCEAIVIAHGAAVPSIIAAQMARWHSGGRVTGAGAATTKALSELAFGGHWALVGRKGEMAAGCGAAMRIAPLAFILDPADASARQVIRDVSRITHHNEEAYCGALAVALAIRAAWTDAWTRGAGLLEIVAEGLPDCATRDRCRELANVGRLCALQEMATRFGCSGHVVDVVPLALLAAERAALTFSAILEEIVKVGGDTDTAASIMGQIVGASLGFPGVQQDFLSKVADSDTVVEIAANFANLVGRPPL
jgi:ADP-ribosylglycohydrolase